MKDCIIMPDRGDRQKMSAFVKAQMGLTTKRPQNSYYIFDQPTDHQPDLTKRIRRGIELAERDGCEVVYIVESDDCYPANYFELMDIGDNDFVGYSDTYYYSIKSKTWQHEFHKGRSSLFCTGFRISALKDFRWPPDHYLWLDVELWNYARDQRKKVKLMENNPCTGIKGHFEGKHAGKSHLRTFEHPDYDMNFLRKRTDDYQFYFLKNWK